MHQVLPDRQFGLAIPMLRRCPRAPLGRDLSTQRRLHVRACGIQIPPSVRAVTVAAQDVLSVIGLSGVNVSIAGQFVRVPVAGALLRGAQAVEACGIGSAGAGQRLRALARAHWDLVSPQVLRGGRYAGPVERFFVGNLPDASGILLSSRYSEHFLAAAAPIWALTCLFLQVLDNHWL